VHFIPKKKGVIDREAP